MRTMIAVLFVTTLGFTAATTAVAAGAPGHVVQPPKPSNAGKQAIVGGGLRLSAGALGSKFGSSRAPVSHETTRR